MKFGSLPKCILFAGCCLLLVSSCIRGTSHSAFSMRGEKIKIAVLKNVKELKIENVSAIEAFGCLLPPASSGMTTISLEESGNLIINGDKANCSKATFFSENGMLSLNGHAYRGKIEIIKEQSGLLVVNELPLEFYVAGLINHEISSKWPMEAVKAQAVIARTYAIYQKKKRDKGLYHMEATVADQVYSGSTAEDDRSLHAVKETIGEVLTYNGELALTVYHSNGGGMTEDSQNIWGKDYPYLKQAKSPFDKDAPNFSWTLNISPESVETALKNAGYRISSIKDIMPLAKTTSGRIAKLRIYHDKGELEISGEDLRRTLGYDRLKSAMFTVEMKNGSFVFTGKGSGHGVGLSQWGAKGMAEKGYRYAEILGHFYPGTRIERIY